MHTALNAHALHGILKMYDGTTPEPDISVLLATHNGARFIESAVASIQAQSFTNFELIIVDDASTDETPEILARLAAADPRIRVFRPAENLKLAKALNFGLEHARGTYIARMDDDDLAMPERLAVQKAYLEANPGITLVGSSIEWIDETGKVLHRSVRGRDSYAVSWSARFAPSVPHPTFMFHRILPDGTPVCYDPDSPVGQDYELICRLILGGAQVACLADVLLQYRTHTSATSRTKHAKQRDIARRVGEGYQSKTLPLPLFDALAPLREFYFDIAKATPERIAGAFAGTREMIAYDVAATPERKVWVRRQAAQFLATCLVRGGASTKTVGMAFLRYGPELLPAVVLRALETRGWMPKALHSDPLMPFAKSG